MKKNHNIAIILTLVVVAIFVALFLVLKNFQKKTLQQSVDPFSLVPSDAIAILHSRSPALLVESLIKTGPMATDLGVILSGTDIVSRLQIADSLIAPNETIYAAWKNTQIIVSMHPGSGNSAKEYLFNIRIPAGLKEKVLDDFIRSKFMTIGQVGDYSFSGKKIYTYTIPDKNQKLFYHYSGGILLFSTSSGLLEASLTGLASNNNITTQSRFDQLRQSSGRFADNLYWNIKSLCGHLQNPLFADWPLVIDCQSFSGWQAWDISYNTGHLVFNGFALPSDDAGNLASLLKHQKPIQTSVWENIPLQTTMMIYIGLSDMDVFSGKLKFYREYLGKGEELADKWSRFKDITGLNADSLKDFWTGELAWVLPFGATTDEQVILAGIQDRDMILNHRVLKLFFKEVGLSGQYTMSVFGELRQSAIPGLLSVLTRGLVSQDFEYLGFSDNWIIAAKTPQALAAYDQKLRFGQNMNKGNAVKNMQDNLQPAQNVLLHISLPLLFSSVEGSAEDSIAMALIEKNKDLRHFDQISLQLFPSPGPLVYSNWMMQHRPGFVVANPLAWTTDLESNVIKGPYKVINHNTRASEIVVQDDKNNLYLIDISGKILWKNELSGPVMSDIYQVDIFKNNRYQYLFNTRNFLHLFDRNGNYVKGYPMRLPSPASAGIAVYDYDRNKNYRIIFPAENQRIFNYNLGRKPVSGWDYKRSKNLVTKPVQHIRLAGKDFLFAIDTLGNLEILDRRGNSRITPRQAIKVNPRTKVFANTTGRDPHFMVAGDNGILNQIKPDGTINQFTPDVFSSQYMFLYADLLQNNNMEMIFVDKDVLRVFDHAGKALFSLQLSDQITTPPRILEDKTHGKFIGILDTTQKLIFLADTQGTIRFPFPVPGDSDFYFEYDSGQNLMLITAINNQIVGYKINFQEGI